MTTIDDMQAASEKISTILAEMERCVLRTEEALTNAKPCTGQVTVWAGGELTTDALPGALSWTRVHAEAGSLGTKFGIAVWEDARWRHWCDAPLYLKLVTFPRLRDLVVKINMAVQAALLKAISCQTANPDLDTLLGAPAPASGGEGES